MRALTAFRIAAVLMITLFHGHVSAVEFVMVGPRAMGMGGAGVAVTTDALATYWNPAGLAMTQTVDIRIVGGGQGIDRLGVADAIKDLEDFNPNAPDAAAKAQDIANRLNRPGANTSLNGAAGLYVKGHFGEHAFGFNISDVATGGGFISTPVQVSGTDDYWRHGIERPGSKASGLLLCLCLCRQDIFNRHHGQSDSRGGL